jgi:DNA polymerase
MSMTNRRLSQIDVLAFHVEAGVDVALEEKPVDRFAESAPGHPGSRQAAVRDPESKAAQKIARAAVLDPGPPLRSGRDDAQKAPPAADQAVIAARTAAKAVKSLDELREALARFEGCALKATATQLVFARGSPQARVMFVGEAPGAEEDREGAPFVGRAGRLLDRMLAAIELDESSAYIANIVPWRPPGNRTPTPQEAAICLPFIARQIELANPDILVCLGKPSMQTLLGINEGIRSARGRWREYDTGTRKIRALATFHPAYLLRTPLEKRHAWRDFLAIKKALAG